MGSSAKVVTTGKTLQVASSNFEPSSAKIWRRRRPGWAGKRASAERKTSVATQIWVKTAWKTLKLKVRTHLQFALTRPDAVRDVSTDVQARETLSRASTASCSSSSCYARSQGGVDTANSHYAVFVHHGHGALRVRRHHAYLQAQWIYCSNPQCDPNNKLAFSVSQRQFTQLCAIDAGSNWCIQVCLACMQKCT